jgi:hypothetical protein
MIIKSETPFTIEQIEQAKECFGEYIKTVIDVEQKICTAEMDRHFD